MLLEQKQLASLHNLPDGPEGVRATLDFMVELARANRTNPVIRRMAEKIIADVPQKDYVGEAAAIQRFVRDAIRYTMDIDGVETLKDPVTTLGSGMGDCDDKALLAASLLISIGHPSRFVAIGFNGANSYEHVYVETRIGTRWVPVETTENVDLGWSPQGVTSTMIRHI